MNRLSRCLLLSCLVVSVAAGIAGCADDAPAEPEEPIPSIVLEEANRSLHFSPEEGVAEIYFQVQGIWRAVVTEPADQWCRVTPSKGGSGTAWVRVKVARNESPEERNATIMIECAGISKNVVVTQKGVNSLTVTRSKLEVGREGGTVEAEVKSNVSFEYEIDIECADWIEASATRSLQTSKLRFEVAPYEGGPVREGRIRIFGEGLEETVHVYQEGTDPSIVVSQDEYVLSAKAETIRVELCSNVAYEVEMPEAEWIEDVSTRVLSSHTHYYAVAENTSEEDRSAEIRYTDRATGCTNSVRILQKGKGVAVVAKDEYRISPAGGYVRFDIQYNNEVEVRISYEYNWVERVYRTWTRSMQTEEVLLKVSDKGYNGFPRTAEVLIEDGEGELLKKIRIRQTNELDLVVSEDERLISAEGGDLVVELSPWVPFRYEMYSGAKSWVRYVETVGNRVRFQIEKNTQNDTRAAYIDFISPSVRHSGSVYILQMPKQSVVLASDSYHVSNEGGSVEVEIRAAPEVTFAVDITDDWLERIESRWMEMRTLRFRAAPNPDGEYRAATVRIIPDDGNTVQTFRIVQVPEDAAVISEREYRFAETGGIMRIKIRTDAEYTVSDPDAGWLHRYVPSWEMENPELYYTADPNDTFESREAEVVVRNEATGKEEKVRITQLQKDALVVAESAFRMGLEGGRLDFDVRANVPLEVEVEPEARGWLTRVETRVFALQTLHFEVAPAAEDREGLITIRGGGMTQTISVLQSAAADFGTIERSALRAFYEATGGRKWKRSDNWGTEKPLSEWYGVTVSGGRVTELRLPENALSGRVPPELGELTALECLDVKNNRITGSLPDVFGRLVKLETLDLSGNGMGGDLPQSMGDLPQLRLLDLSRNEFTGRLPETFARLEALEEIYACESGLMGSIASVPDGSPALRVIDLSSNRFSGGIPDSMYELSRLSVLKLRDNPISGVISSAIQNLSELKLLDLSSSCISGDLPSSIGKLVQLEELYLNDAQMSGTLPESFGYMRMLRELRLDNNMFSGALPAGLKQRGDLWAKWWGSVLDQRGAGFDQEDELPGPKFIVEDIDGQRLGSGMIYTENQLTILFQFKTDDPESAVCISELNKLYEDYGQFGLEVIGYAYDPLSEVRAYVKQLHVGWPVVCVDSQTGTNDVFRVSLFPAMNLIDKNGKTILNCFMNGSDEMIRRVREHFQPFKPYVSTDYSSNKKVETLQKATRGAGIDVVLMGDGFTDLNIADGTYDKAMRRAMEHFFSEEPFTSFRNCFNVHAVTVVSPHEGYFTGSKSALGTEFQNGGTVGGDNDLCREYALAVPSLTEEKLDETLVIVMMNSKKYAGTSYLFFSADSAFGSGFAVCYFPLGKDDEMFAQLLHHEAGGHGFAKLADEYGVRYLPIPQEEIDRYRSRFPYGWWRNVDFTADPASVKWSRLLADSRYAAEALGVYEGGCEYSTGAYRPTENSIMRDNTGGFNAPSREAIYMRIMRLAYGPEWAYDYEEFVLWDLRNRTAAPSYSGSRAAERDFVPLPPPVVMERR